MTKPNADDNLLFIRLLHLSADEDDPNAIGLGRPGILKQTMT